MSSNNNRWMRQVHRWVSLAFTAAVLINLVANATAGEQGPPLWVGLLALVPLIVLLVTGLYLFALPYLSKRRSEQRIHA